MKYAVHAYTKNNGLCEIFLYVQISEIKEEETSQHAIKRVKKFLERPKHVYRKESDGYFNEDVEMSQSS